MYKDIRIGRVCLCCTSLELIYDAERENWNEILVHQQKLNEVHICGQSFKIM